MSDFIELTDDGVHMTCALPADETIVEVRLEDGSTHRAWYSCNLMEAGDWDFAPVDADDEPTDYGFDSNVAAWRPLSATVSS